MTLLDEIRARDEHYGDSIPDHYQSQLDRRNLLRMLDEAQNKADLVPSVYDAMWSAQDKIIAVKDLEPYVDGGVISWELIKKAIL